MLVVALAGLSGAALPPITEPFPLLHGNVSGSVAQPTSPDPLVGTTWSADTNLTSLQRYEASLPHSWVADPPSSFSGLDSLKAAGNPHIAVSGAGTLRLDFGVEHAAWIEIRSPDLPNGTLVKAAISDISLMRWIIFTKPAND